MVPFNKVGKAHARASMGVFCVLRKRKKQDPLEKKKKKHCSAQ